MPLKGGGKGRESRDPPDAGNQRILIRLKGKGGSRIGGSFKESLNPFLQRREENREIWRGGRNGYLTPLLLRKGDFMFISGGKILEERMGKKEKNRDPLTFD